MERPDQRMSHTPGKGVGPVRFHHVTRHNIEHLLIFSRILHLMYSDHCRLGVSGTTGRKTEEKGELLFIHTWRWGG